MLYKKPSKKQQKKRCFEHFHRRQKNFGDSFLVVEKVSTKYYNGIFFEENSLRRSGLNSAMTQNKTWTKKTSEPWRCFILHKRKEVSNS